jgi:hypothetical protein
LITSAAAAIEGREDQRAKAAARECNDAIGKISCC